MAKKIATVSKKTISTNGKSATQDAATNPPSTTTPTEINTTAGGPAPKKDPSVKAEVPPKVAPAKEKTLWEQVGEAKDDEELYKILFAQLSTILSASNAGKKYHVLMLYSDDYSITRYTTDRIYATLRNVAKDRDKPLLLLILSNGGSVESAYLISKACKEYSKDIFAVAIPRHAKSAATLLALGADAIHMGLMSELGPIDPQMITEPQSRDRVPALALKHALENVADLCEKYPKATSMFSEYLAKTLKVTQLGYYERICKSAAQYAERLLKRRYKGKGEAEKMANKLVYEYKDHGFVIDHEEAVHIFGDLIKYDSEESQLAEKVHEFIESFDLAINILKSKKLGWILGRLDRQSTYIKDQD